MTATDLLAHVQRGPCGGWHWTGVTRHHDHHPWRCRACIALGARP